MKTVYLIIILFYNISFSQLLPGGNRERYEENSSSTSSNNSAYINLNLNFLQINDYFGVEGALGFGNILKNNLILGGGINSVLFDSFKIQNEGSELIRYTNGYFKFGYLIDMKYVYPSFNLNLGAGRMNSSTLAIGVNADPNGDWYIYLEPNLNFDVKLYKKNYLNFCFNYRFYNGIENYNLKNSDFNGFVFNFGYTLILK